MKDTRNRWVAEAVALLLPILLLCSPFLFRPRVLDGREFRAVGRVRAEIAREATAGEGEWPRWNGAQHAGAPFLGDLQGSLHYPPNLLPLAVAPDRAIGYLFVAHMIATAIGMYRLARYFEFRRSAAVLGGSVYGVSLMAAAHLSAGSLSHYVIPALAPWILLLVLRMLKRISMVRLSLLAAALGAALLGGDPQDLPFLVLMGAGLIVWSRVDAGRRKRPWKKTAIIPIAIAAVLGVALSSAALLPAIEVARYAAAAPRMSEVVRDWRILYAGVLPTVVALLPFQSPKRGPALFFAIAAVLGALPPLVFPRLPVCSLWVVALSLSSLAAMGWDGLARGRYAPRIVAWIVGTAAAAVVTAAGLVAWRHRMVVEAATIVGLLAATALVVTRLHARPWAIVAAILLTTTDLCFFGARVIRTVEPDDVLAEPWYASRIGPERREFRLLDTTSSDPTPAVHGFRLLNGYGYPKPKSSEASSATLEDLNVRWMVADARSRPPGRWKELARDGDRLLLENPDARRAAYLLASDEEAGAPLKILRSANTIEVSGRTYQAVTLAVSESWMPGWKAYMARREIPVVRADNGLLRIDVPDGDWYVTLRYEPDPYRVGRVISSSAVALLLGLLVAGMKRAKIAIS